MWYIPALIWDGLWLTHVYPMFILRYPRSYYPWLDLENTLDSSGIYLTGLLVTQTHACIYLARFGISQTWPGISLLLSINQLILCHNCDGRVQEHSSAHCSVWTLTFLLPPSKTSSPMIRWSHCSTWTCRMSWDLQKGRTPTSGVYQSWTTFYAGIWWQTGVG